MAKISLADYLKERAFASGRSPDAVGPFITISRQYGCYGFSLGLLLLEILNEEAPPEKIWKIYHREILETLATRTNVAAELLDLQRHEKPSYFTDFFRGLSSQRLPSTEEIRNRIATIVRGLAIQGYAIIVGQGGAGVTSDLPNGLSVRLEAPEAWRVRQIAQRERISDDDAKTRILATEKQREHQRHVYEERFPRQPAFNLVYDCSVFSLTQIAQQIVYAMKLRGITG